MATQTNGRPQEEGLELADKTQDGRVCGADKPRRLLGLGWRAAGLVRGVLRWLLYIFPQLGLIGIIRPPEFLFVERGRERQVQGVWRRLAILLAAFRHRGDVS